ncbi:MAG: SsrA-binding protein [Candidatus Roizmanbacteria bacterium GW2011_GWA2_32_13]|uniref:SsrA-binding protein n=1 Tax=Candidatus Roizmanbacteria bacterium GW2011_GWA2_32_13 TaxID=1618475 RepID=A0A0F9YMZ1_9BACT|nr:MAG: SsrA-binding protein [Candidatus Roizmanbacteria bacterium GW2011_GWA2_32_13]
MKPIINKGIIYRFSILKKMQAGISLLGFEVKSIKSGKISLNGSFVKIKNNEAILSGVDISLYQKGNYKEDYNSKRDRKLLLKKDEIRSLIGLSAQKGLTILPLKIYTKANLIKLEIGVARGFKKRDKREKIKEKEYTRRKDKLLKLKSV